MTRMVISSSSGRDAAFAKQRGKRGFDPPAAAHRQLLAGAGFEKPARIRLELSLICKRRLLSRDGDPPRQLVGRHDRAG